MSKCEKVIPTLGVGDVAPAIDWYVNILEFSEAWRWGEPPAHAAVMLGDAEVHLSQTPANPGGSWLYFVVPDVDALHARVSRAGADVVHVPTDQEWGMREMHLRDLVGNELTFATPRSPTEPKIPIEREGVHVRLERRLLALLRDLAEHKGFDLTATLEETLLHTFERMPGGAVASPHTEADLLKIAELKRKHGIDYEVHASYRFEERADET